MSSNLGADIYSSLQPHILPFSLLYKKSSVVRLSSATLSLSLSSDCIQDFIYSSKLSLALISPNKGSISFCGLRLVLSLTLRFICIARLGITSRSLSAFTRYSLMPDLPIATAYPATDNGLSSHVDIIIPPYFSTLRLM